MRRSKEAIPRPAPGPNTLRDHLANERTFLAWMRTAIAIVALGFVVSRFGIFLRELSGKPHEAAVRFGAVVGVALVLAGVASAVLAALRFMRTRHDIEYDIVDFRPWPDLVLAGIVAIVSVVMAVYLVATS